MIDALFGGLLGGCGCDAPRGYVGAAHQTGAAFAQYNYANLGDDQLGRVFYGMFNASVVPPLPPGIHWRRTGGKTHTVTIVRR